MVSSRAGHPACAIPFAAGLYMHHSFGGDEQMIGAKQQIPNEEQSY